MNTNKSTDQAKPTRKNGRLDSTMRDLAAGLRDVITATAGTALEEDPEDTFTDLAFRFVSELQKRGLMITALPTSEERIQRAMSKAAADGLETLTGWMRNNPGCSYDTRMSATGKFQIVLRTAEGPKLLFGGDVQDVYGQAATIIRFNGGNP